MHEIKYDGHRMHARLDGGQVALLTRTGLAWSHRYRHTIEALRTLLVKSAYLDGKVKINFDAGTVDQMIERLLVLQTQMLPKPAPARKRN